MSGGRHCEQRASGGCTTGAKGRSLLQQYRLDDGVLVAAGWRCLAHLVRLPEEDASCSHSLGSLGGRCAFCGTLIAGAS